MALRPFPFFFVGTGRSRMQASLSCASSEESDRGFGMGRSCSEPFPRLSRTMYVFPMRRIRPCGNSARRGFLFLQIASGFRQERSVENILPGHAACSAVGSTRRSVRHGRGKKGDAKTAHAGMRAVFRSAFLLAFGRVNRRYADRPCWGRDRKLGTNLLVSGVFRGGCGRKIPRGAVLFVFRDGRRSGRRSGRTGLCLRRIVVSGARWLFSDGGADGQSGRAERKGLNARVPRSERSAGRGVRVVGSLRG